MPVDRNRRLFERAHELYHKPIPEKLTEPEIQDILKYLKTIKHRYRIIYGFYKQGNSKKGNIEFLIDSDAQCPRKSGYLNTIEIFCTRKISDLELLEEAQNWGTNTRRFQTWHYRDVEHLIIEDKKYNVETPSAFIDECRRRGYSGNYQSKIEFE